MDLRQRQRERRTQDILDAARQFLVAKGYDETSMEEIAGRAEVGTATVYNYFHSKAELFFQLFAAETDKLVQEAQPILSDAPTDPVQGVSALLCTYITELSNRFSKGLLREFLATAFSQEFTYGARAWPLDLKLLGQLRQLLELLRARGSIQCGVQLTEASLLLYSIFTAHFMMFVVTDTTLEATQDGMRRGITLAFDGIEPRHKPAGGENA